MVPVRTVSLLSFVLVTLVIVSVQDGRPTATVAAGIDMYAGRDANDSTRAGCCTAKTGSTAADTGIFSPLIDSRMMRKPRSFSCREEDWGTIFDGDTTLLWSEMEASALPAGAVLNAGMQPDRRHRSQTPFYFLVMLMEGRALMIAENCKTAEGLELWRQLVEAYHRSGKDF